MNGPETGWVEVKSLVFGPVYTQPLFGPTPDTGTFYLRPLTVGKDKDA